MRVGRALVSVGVALAAALVLAACAPKPLPVDVTAPTPTLASDPDEAGREPAAIPITFVSVIDGDTIKTSAGTVSIIGIDTPSEASAATTKPPPRLRASSLSPLARNQYP